MGDGTSCLTEEDFKFSKEFLYHLLQNDPIVKDTFGLEGVQTVQSWLKQKIFIHEENWAIWPKAGTM